MSAYDTIDLRPSWAGTSVLSFVLTVLFIAVVALTVRAYRNFHFWSTVIWLTLPTLSLVGTVAALMALRRRPRPASAVVGLVLNGTVLGSCIVALFW